MLVGIDTKFPLLHIYIYTFCMCILKTYPSPNFRRILKLLFSKSLNKRKKEIGTKNLKNNDTILLHILKCKSISWYLILLRTFYVLYIHIKYSGKRRILRLNNLNLKPIFGTEQKVVHSSYNWQNCNADISARVFFKSIDVLWTSLGTKRKFFHNLRERILC